MFNIKYAPKLLYLSIFRYKIENIIIGTKVKLIYRLFQSYEKTIGKLRINKKNHMFSKDNMIIS